MGNISKMEQTIYGYLVAWNTIKLYILVFLVILLVAKF